MTTKASEEKSTFLKGEGEQATDQWQRYSYMRDNGHMEFLRKAETCERFFRGLQWNELDLALLKIQNRPALTINKILSTLSTIFGEQILNRMEVTFRPVAGSPPENADIHNKVWKYLASKNQLQWIRSDVFADGLIRSRGFMDVRISFDTNMYGDVVISKLNSKNVLIDPDAEEYDPDKWNDVIVSKWMAPADIESTYGKEKADLLRDRDSSAYMYGYDSIEQQRDRFGDPKVGLDGHGVATREQSRYIRVLDRQFREVVKQRLFVDSATGDMRAIPDSWNKNRIAEVMDKYRLHVIERPTKRIRWRVSADTVILHDEWSPYKHLTTVPYFPYFRDGHTIGVVENLLSSQEMLNKTSSQELHVINTTANSGWKVKRGSLQNMTIEELAQRGAETGLVMELEDPRNDAEKITPNPIPQGLERMSFKAEEHIKGISNVSDSLQGFDREDVAAKAITAKQNRGAVNFTKFNDSLNRTDWYLARAVQALVQGYMTEERVLNITHNDLLAEPEELVVNQYDEATGSIVNDLTVGEYEVLVSSTPHRDSLEDAQFEHAVEMRNAGVPIPDDVLVQNSRLMNKADVAKRMAEAQSDPNAQAMVELDIREREATVGKLEAETQRLKAEAAKKLKESQEIGSEDGAEEFSLEKYKIDQELTLERYKIDEENKIKREQMEREAALKREQQNREAQLERAKQLTSPSIN